MALATQWHARWFRCATWTILLYSLFYLIAAGFFEGIVFPGCGNKGHLVNRYEFDFATGCVGDLGRMLHKLFIPGSPRLAIVASLTGAALLVLSLGKGRRVA